MISECDLPGRIRTEANDCSVIGLSYAFGLSYQSAHNICKQLGRQDNECFDVGRVLMPNKFRKYTMFLNRTLRFFGSVSSVRMLMAIRPSGSYLVTVHNHIFAMVNGTVYDQFDLNQEVKSFIKID